MLGGNARPRPLAVPDDLPASENQYWALDRFTRLVCAAELGDLMSRIPPHPAIVGHRREECRIMADHLLAQANRDGAARGIPFAELDSALRGLGGQIVGVMNLLGRPWWPADAGEAGDATRIVRERIEGCMEASARVIRLAEYYGCPVPRAYPGGGQALPTWDEIIAKLAEWEDWQKGPVAPPPAATGEPPGADAPAPAVALTPAPKRSTERGEGRAKLIAALTKHHQYADGGCLNLVPIGNNELAKAARVSAATASAFFSDKFQGHTKYKALCRDAGKLTAALKLLNDEFAPYHLLGAASSDLAAPEQDDGDWD